MMTKVMTKSSKINQRTTQVNQERFKVQDLKNQDQDSRIKRRLNQDKYEKFFSKIE